MNKNISERLRVLRKESIDGYPKKSPMCETSLEYCTAFMEAYPDIADPDITLAFDGTVIAEWRKSKDQFVSFAFMMGGSIEFYTARKRANGSLHRAAGTLSRFNNADIHETMLNMLIQNEATAPKPGDEAMNRNDIEPCACPGGLSEVEAYHMLIEDCYFVRCDYCGQCTDEFESLEEAMKRWKKRALLT